MEEALSRFEAAVAVAAGVPPDAESASPDVLRRYQQAVEFVNNLGRSPDHAQMCVIALSRAKEPASRHMALTGLQTLLGDARLSQDLLRKLQQGVLAWLRDHFVKGGASREPSHVLRKASHMLAVLVRRTYPTNWSSAWRDISSLMCPVTATRMRPALASLAEARGNPEGLARAEQRVRACAVSALAPGSPDAPRFSSAAEASDRQRLACHVCFLGLVQEIDAEIASRDALRGTLRHEIRKEETDAGRATAGAVSLSLGGAGGGAAAAVSAGERKREELNRVKDAMRSDGSLALACAACADALALVPAVLRMAPGAFGAGDTPLAAVVRQGAQVLAQVTPWADAKLVSAPPLLKFHDNVLRAGAAAAPGSSSAAGAGASASGSLPPSAPPSSSLAPAWLRLGCMQCLRAAVRKGMPVPQRLAMVVQSGMHSLAAGQRPPACDMRATRRRRRALSGRAMGGERPSIGHRVVFEQVAPDGARPEAFLDLTQQGELAVARETCALAALLLQLGLEAAREPAVRSSEPATAACVSLLRAVVPWALDLFAGSPPEAALELGGSIRALANEARPPPGAPSAADAIFGGAASATGRTRAGDRPGIVQLPGFAGRQIVEPLADSLLVAGQYPPGWEYREPEGDEDYDGEDSESDSEDEGGVAAESKGGGGGGSARFAAYADTVPAGADAVRLEVAKAARDAGRFFPAETLGKILTHLAGWSVASPGAAEPAAAVLAALKSGQSPLPAAPLRAMADAANRADGSHWRGKAYEWDGLESAMMLLYWSGEGIVKHQGTTAQQLAAICQLVAAAPWTHPQVEVVMQFMDICQRFSRVFGTVPALFEPVVRALQGKHGIASPSVAVRERAAYVLLDTVKQAAKLPRKAGQPAVGAAAKPLLASLRQRLAPARLPSVLMRAAQGGDASARAAVAKVQKAAPSCVAPPDRRAPALSVSAQGHILELCGFLLKQPWVPAAVRGGFTSEALKPMGQAVAAAQGALVEALNRAAAARLQRGGSGPPSLPASAHEALRSPAVDTPPWAIALCRYTADLMRGVASLVKPFHHAGPELRPTLSTVVRGAVDVIRGLGCSAAHPLHPSVAAAIFGGAPGAGSGAGSGGGSARAQPRKAVRWPPRLAAACDRLRLSARLVLHHATYSLGPEAAHHIERAVPSLLCVHPNALASSREAALGGPGAREVQLPNHSLYLTLILVAHTVNINGACPANASLLLRCLPLLLACLRACGADTDARIKAGTEALNEAAARGARSGDAGAGGGPRGGPPQDVLRAFASARTSAAGAVVAAAQATYKDVLMHWLRLLKDTIEAKLQGAIVFAGSRAGAAVLQAATSKEGGPAAAARVAREACPDGSAMQGSVLQGVLGSLQMVMTSRQCRELHPSRGAADIVKLLLDAWTPMPPMPTSSEGASSGSGGGLSSPSSPKGGKPRYLDLSSTSPAREGAGGVHPTAASSPTRGSLLPVDLQPPQRQIFLRWCQEQAPDALVASLTLPPVRPGDPDTDQLVQAVAAVLVGLGRRAALRARDERMAKVADGGSGGAGGRGGGAVSLGDVPVAASWLAGRLAGASVPGVGRAVAERASRSGGPVRSPADVQAAGRRFAQEVHAVSVSAGKAHERVGRAVEPVRGLAAFLHGGQRE